MDEVRALPEELIFRTEYNCDGKRLGHYWYRNGGGHNDLFVCRKSVSEIFDVPDDADAIRIRLSQFGIVIAACSDGGITIEGYEEAVCLDEDLMDLIEPHLPIRVTVEAIYDKKGD